MKILLISILKLGLRIIYAPLKLLRTKNRIVYLSRQSNEKSLDMRLLEKAIKDENPSVEQVFRLRMLGDGIGEKIKYSFSILGDMYYLATSKIAIVDTYSITVSCLKHKKDLKVIQMWHALGAIKKFGLQALGTKEGRDEKLSRAMCMHKNYDYVLAPSAETARFYMQAFGVEQEKIKLCPLPRVDFLTDSEARTTELFYNNPSFGQKKIVLYLPTFRDRDEYIAQMLKTEFEDRGDYQLLICAHPLSKAKREDKYLPKGDFTSAELMKIADIIITDYSACAFEAAVLMKPLYFFVPDYNEYIKDRGINIQIKDEMPLAVFDTASELVDAMEKDEYDMDSLYRFKEKYVESSKGSNAEILAKFVNMLMGE